MADLPLDLFKRIADRANDPMRRTYMAGVHATAQPLDFGALMADLQKHGAPGAQGLLGAFGKMQSMMGGMMGGMTMMGPGGAMSMGGAPAGPQPLAPPPSAQAIDDAGAAIGRPLPDEVQQLYAISDGGFGPGEGLMPLTQLVARYGDLTREPYGPLGQDWPKNLATACSMKIRCCPVSTWTAARSSPGTRRKSRTKTATRIGNARSRSSTPAWPS